MRSPQDHTPPCPGVFRRFNFVLAGLLCAAAATSVHAQYSESFSANPPAGWLVVSGSWSASGGFYNNTANVFPAVSIYNTTTWASHTVRARMKNAWTGAGNRVGIVFDYQNATNFYYVSANAAGLVELLRYNGSGYGTVVASGTFTGGSLGNVWFDLEVVRTGTKTSVNVTLGATTQTVISNVTQTEWTSGKIGLLTRYTTTGQFDSITVGVPEVNLTGNGLTIASGDSSPKLADNTIMGYINVASGNVTRSFTIQNTGGSTLSVGTVTKTVGPADFTITQPGTTSIAAGSSTTFSVKFDPSVVGQRSATLSFSTNDSNENPYTFVVTAWGIDNTNRPYPRLGAFPIGSPHGYQDTSFQNWAKKFDLMILGAYPGWNISKGMPLETAILAIKSGSPRTLAPLVFNYTNAMEQEDNPNANYAFRERRQKIIDENWWAYELGTSGAKSPTGYNYYVNVTDFAPQDFEGLRSQQWTTRWLYQQYKSPGTGLGGPTSLDGFFQDNLSSQPEHGPGRPDWNRNGVKESWEVDQPNGGLKAYQNEITRRQWREGRAQVRTMLNSLWSGSYQVCNVATWGKMGSMASYPMVEYDGKWQGGVIEGTMGKSYSAETWGTYQTLMNYYKWTMERFAAPKLGFFELDFQGYDPYTAANLQLLRYGLATCLIGGDAFIWAHRGGGVDDPLHGRLALGYSTDPQNLNWFDELDNTGTNPAYLGQPRETFRTGPRWLKGPIGIWAREFDGGIAIANPKGNGPQTVTVADLGGSNLWKRILGTQAPTINNGLNVTSDIQLNERDGIILLRR